MKKELGKDIKKIKGTGAAGGLDTGLAVFLNTNLRSDTDIIIEATGLEDKNKRCSGKNCTKHQLKIGPS